MSASSLTCPGGWPGLYGDDGLLHHVGFTSSIKDEDRKALTAKLERLRKPPGFTGRAPGGPSRWSTERTGEWEPLKPVLVVEVAFDQYTGGRFRHGTRFLRRRPDMAPAQCTFDQLGRKALWFRLWVPPQCPHDRDRRAREYSGPDPPASWSGCATLGAAFPDFRLFGRAVLPERPSDSLGDLRDSEGLHHELPDTVASDGAFVDFFAESSAQDDG